MSSRVKSHVILFLISLEILIAAVFHKWISFCTNSYLHSGCPVSKLFYLFFCTL